MAHDGSRDAAAARGIDSAMQFRYEPQPDHLLVTLAGRFELAACHAALPEILRLCRDRQLANILIDARAITELVPIADRFDLARVVAAAQPPRIAILVTPDNEAYTRAFEHTAVGEGAAVKTTADEATAHRFLGIR